MRFRDYDIVQLSCISYQGLQNSANLAEIRFKCVQAHFISWVLLKKSIEIRKMESKFGYKAFFDMDLNHTEIIVEIVSHGAKLIFLSLNNHYKILHFEQIKNKIHFLGTWYRSEMRVLFHQSNFVGSNENLCDKLLYKRFVIHLKVFVYFAMERFDEIFPNYNTKFVPHR
ncbi:hypothetical protein BpHYR1_032479 [Brachionus plicatilis]|uniref:Uncharacterized protein n=1 Tax=Brachionus plicatilis TaxID=10195 RepID=A0A3M7QKX8_BRAPC|nr:hypothetical protein BpHYR1_032479 [Brachionus plicatilis]